MPYKMFRIPAGGCEETERDLNRFLASHRVVIVTREFVNAGESSFWCFCVDYLDGSAGKAKEEINRNRIDYREVLQPSEFALFAKLRDLRKDLATADGVPIYTVFTNQQLAEIAKSRAATLEGIRKIAGLGEARIEKYGSQIVEIAIAHWEENREEGGRVV